MLDRLESALGSREPALAELVRELRWRCCDEPLVEEGRQETYATMESHLEALADDAARPRGADGRARRRARSRWRR